jgi:hypothetical protein
VVRKLVWLQAFYCIVGILFYVRDLFAKVPMGEAMKRAFIWPYAQWPLMKYQALKMLQPIAGLFE